MPAPRTGNHDLAALLAVENQTVAAYGYDKVVAAIQRILEIHSELMRDGLASLATPTTDRIVPYGGQIQGEMVDVDEYGRSATQRSTGNQGLGLPLNRKQYAVGWTRQFELLKTPADVARMTIAAMAAHRRAVLEAVRRALLNPFNYSFTDYLDDSVTLAVKALVNGDGMDIAINEYGTSFDGATHSHYDAINWAASTAEQRDAALVGIVNDVMEHGHAVEPRLYIAQTDEAKVRSVPSFEPYVSNTILPSPGDSRKQTDRRILNNRPIGMLGAAEVWTKPWAAPLYPVAIDAGSAPPLGYREPAAGKGQKGLVTAGEISMFPLHTQYLEADFGVGVQNRTNGAVLYLGGNTYVAPAD